MGDTNQFCTNRCHHNKKLNQIFTHLHLFWNFPKSLINEQSDITLQNNKLLLTIFRTHMYERSTFKTLQDQKTWSFHWTSLTSRLLRDFPQLQDIDIFQSSKTQRFSKASRLGDKQRFKTWRLTKVFDEKNIAIENRNGCHNASTNSSAISNPHTPTNPPSESKQYPQ